MGASDAFLEAVKPRRSNYTLSSETTIPDSKVVEIVQTAIKHAPSTYNVQSARAVVLFGESHHKFWDIATSHISALPMDENAKKYLTSRLSGFRGAHGTVLFFEDQAALDTLGTKNAMVQPMLTECKYSFPSFFVLILVCVSCLGLPVPRKGKIERYGLG